MPRASQERYPRHPAIDLPPRVASVGIVRAALLGALFIVGRAVYFVGYTRAAEARHTGFLLSIVPNTILLFGGLVGVVRALF